MTKAEQEMEKLYEKVIRQKPNSANAEKKLIALAELYDVDIADTLDYLEEYRNLDRSDYDCQEEYAEERAEAWAVFCESILEIDAEE